MYRTYSPSKQDFLTLKLSELTVFFLVFGLFSTVTNLVPLSLMAFLWLALFLPLVPLCRGRIPKATAWAYVYYVVSLAGIATYNPEGFLEGDFYRYDGNFLISFFPLLVLPAIPRINLDVDLLLKRFAVFSILVSMFIGIYQYITTGYATGLFVTTNAFGGFLMFIIAIIAIWLFQKRRPIFIVTPLLMIALLLIFFSSSRGSLLGLIFGGFIVWGLRRGQKYWPLIFISIIILGQALLLYKTYPSYKSGAIQNQTISESVGYIIEGVDSTKEANVFIRAYENWPRGLHLFLQAPIFGAGVGSANDTPFEFNDGKLLQQNKGDARDYNSAHAHHTFLHIMGEQGIVGLVIFCLMWAGVYHIIRNLNASSFVTETLMVSFWALTFASFTEHRIPSPSNVFPFVLVLVICYANTMKRVGNFAMLNK